MAILHTLSCLALRGVAEGVGAALGVDVGKGADGVINVLRQRFSDHSQHLITALHTANTRAWRAMEIALAGDSWWEQCKARLAAADEKAFREPMRAYLADHPWTGKPEYGPDFRRTCLEQLRAARKAGLLLQAEMDPKKLADGAGQFARFTDPGRIVQVELKAIGHMGTELRSAGYPALADLVEWHPPNGVPILAAAVRFFFRREVEKDQELFQGLAHAQLQDLTASQQQGFSGLADALDRHGNRLEELLGDVHSAVLRAHSDVLDVKAELARQGQQLQELGNAVLEALYQHQLEKRPLRSGDSLSIRDEGERRLVRELVARYRELPQDHRRRLPALLNAVGKLEVVSGEFESAQRDFQELGTLVVDAKARAEALHNAYRAALERRAWAEALAALFEGAKLDPQRMEPFPLQKFEPERILGAGGFGVAFLCRNRHSGGRVVIKTFSGDGLGRDVGEVFREARTLEELEHPAIIRIRDCDYADSGHARPYLVMDYFEGRTLAEHVEQNGPLPPAEVVGLARQVAEGLRAAHARGILHRDVKPANLLVRRAAAWEVKLIDFGLALPTQALKDTVHSRLEKTVAGSSIAGTLEYAAPEQMGKLPGVSVGPSSDVYGFGKTFCFALFRTPQPTFQHWQKLPRDLADLLGRCISEAPKERPASFDAVLRELSRLAPARAKPVPATDVLEVVEEAEEALPALPVRQQPHHPASPPRRDAEPARQQEQSGRGAVWIAVLLPLLVVGAFAVISLLRTNFGGSGGGLFGLMHPAEEKEPPAAPIPPEEFAGLLKEAESTAADNRRPWARRLAETPPTREQEERHKANEKHDDDISRVSRLLDPMIRSEKPAVRIAAAQALQTWGTKENVEGIISRFGAFQEPDAVNKAGVAALTRIGGQRSIDAIAGLLANDWALSRYGVAAALKKIGPDAESAVLPYVKAAQHVSTRRAAVDVLQAIGGKKSITALQEITGSGDPFLKANAETALQTIRGRMGPDPPPTTK
jgi:serine/threonine protein kinase